MFPHLFVERCMLETKKKHLRKWCSGCQDDQAKVRRLDQAGDDHILLMVQKSGDHHLGCIKLQKP